MDRECDCSRQLTPRDFTDERENSSLDDVAARRRSSIDLNEIDTLLKSLSSNARLASFQWLWLWQWLWLRVAAARARTRNMVLYSCWASTHVLVDGIRYTSKSIALLMTLIYVRAQRSRVHYTSKSVLLYDVINRNVYKSPQIAAYEFCLANFY